MSTISRRAFLKTVGVGALSVAAMSVLAGCDTVAPGTDNSAAAVVTGKAGTTYQVSNLVTVKYEKATLDVKVADSTGKTWAELYKEAYIKGTGVTASSTKWSALTSEQKADGKAAAEKAVADLENVKHEISFKVVNYGDAPLFVASSSETSGAFTASVNGVAAKCTLDGMVIGTGSSGETVKCTVKLPLNVEKFDITINVPNAESVVKYTFTNTNYQDPSKIDPSKFGWQAE